MCFRDDIEDNEMEHAAPIRQSQRSRNRVHCQANWDDCDIGFETDDDVIVDVDSGDDAHSNYSG